MNDELTIWTPTTLVDLARAIAWPLAILILGFRLKSTLADMVTQFFKKNRVTEVSASASGIKARFQAQQQQQQSETTDVTAVVNANLPEHMTLEAIESIHRRNSTEFSDALLQQIKQHLAGLNITPDQQIDILSRDNAQLQAMVRFQTISKPLFRSQFDLLTKIASNDGTASHADAEQYFRMVKHRFEDAYETWDVMFYVSYMINAGLITVDDGGYTLTMVGSSYLTFMNRNPQLVIELVNL